MASTLPETLAFSLSIRINGENFACNQIGVSEAMYYTWKKKFGELGVSELKRLKMLEEENATLNEA